MYGMIRTPGRILFMAALTVILLFSWAGYGMAYTETYRTLSKEPITDGVEVGTYNLQTTEGPLNVYVMTTDLSNPYVKVDTLVGKNSMLTSAQGVSNMAKEAGAVGAINGDFFQMDEKAPIGLTFQSGSLITSPARRVDMYGFGLTKDQHPVFTSFGFSGSVTAPNGVKFELFGINKPSYLGDKGSSCDAERLNMYTPRWGATSRGNAIKVTGGMVEVVVENDAVREIRINQAGVNIPPNGYVLAGHGAAARFLTDNLHVGDSVQVDYKVVPENDNLFAAIGGQALLVENGKRHWFSQNITGNKARTAIGTTVDGRYLFFVVVEGGDNSRGMTQEELADFMISIGASTAVNLDGGGSSTIVARHLGDQSVSRLNSTAASSERSIPTGIGVFSTAPAGPLYGLKVTGPSLMLAGTNKVFAVKGYDDHFNPFSVEQSGVVWSVSPTDIGTFNGNILSAVRGGDAVITAQYQNITQDFKVKVLGSEDIAKIEVTPASISLNPGENAAITVKVTSKQGKVFVLLSDEYTIEVKGDIGTVSGSKFIAGDEVSTGELIVKTGLSDVTVKVSIGGVEKPFYGFETAKNLKFRGYPMGQTLGGFRLTNINEPTFRGAGAGRLEYDFTRTSETRAGYGNFEDVLTLPGEPFGIGLHVKGDQGNRHWLRGRLIDANQKEILIDFADKVDWTGWKSVKASIPAGVKYPVRLTDIYLVETKDGSKDKGVIFIDDISLFCAPQPEEIEHAKAQPLVDTKEIIPGTPDFLKLGSELNLSFNNPEGTATNFMTCKQLLDTDLPTPGYNPVFPIYDISGMANGDEISKLSAPMKIEIQVKEAANLNRVRLMFWDASAAKWQQAASSIDTKNLILKGKTNRLGTFGLMIDARPLPVFNDINNFWARDLINKMAAMNIVKGFPNNTFLPTKGVTRAEFVTLLGNTLGWSGQASDLKFNDSIPGWAQSSVAAAVGKGIVKGYDDGTFQPQKVISRAEMAVILDKALSLAKCDKPSNYADANTTPTFAIQSIRNIKEAVIMQGSDNTFRPRAIANRAEATAVMAKVLEYYLSN